MTRRFRFAGLIAVGLVLAFAGQALAALSWSGDTVLGDFYAWNYGNALEFTNVGGNFKLHAVEASSGPFEVMYLSGNGNAGGWGATKRISDQKFASYDGPNIAAVGDKLVVGWVTGFKYGTPSPASGYRVVQVATSSNGGSTWSAPKTMTPATGMADYPIVAGTRTGFGTENFYIAYGDSNTGKVLFRQKVGANAWSAPVVIGTTTYKDSKAGFTAYVGVGASANLVTVSWIGAGNETTGVGTVKSRSINLTGKSASAAATVGNWGPTVAHGKISIGDIGQEGYPLASSSPRRDGVITIAWNTPTAQVYTTYTGGSGATATPKTIWTDGTHNGITYSGGYSTVVEPVDGGGYIASWAACRKVRLASGNGPCYYWSRDVQFDLMVSTSSNGTSWTSPTVLALSNGKGATHQMNDEASIVSVDNKIYLTYNSYNSAYGYVKVYFKTGTGSV